jgi:hypothetical protein
LQYVAEAAVGKVELINSARRVGSKLAHQDLQETKTTWASLGWQSKVCRQSMALGFVLLDLLSHLQSQERRRFDFALKSLARVGRHFVGSQLLLDQLDVLLTGLDILVPEPATLRASGQTQGGSEAVCEGEIQADDEGLAVFNGRK